ncbi:NDR1/HIN1-like protein 6 [Salvia miltiorrhiza]|uniref:NDR1/HIN1-like protein 6 n=1 Tax=Salvia miltiorrhiza TaxID=226208 RepID=UPI0025AC3A56|nr:NDR1/HIN1-like protein 6 [Salvia miltiorrhiza]
MLQPNPNPNPSLKSRSTMSAEKPPPPPLPLRRPPGYRDPSAQIHLQQHPPPPLKRRRRACCRICCCCFCIAAVILILVSASAAFTFYLWLQPRLPQIRLKSVRFSDFNVGTASGGEPVLDAASTVEVEIRNPNRNLGVVYGRSSVALSAVGGDVSLGERRVAGFSQERGGVTTLKLAVKVEGEVVDGRSAEVLRKGFRSGNLVVNAEMRSGVGVRHGRWATAPVEVVVVCGGVRPRGGGSMQPKCRIKVFNWVFIN